MGKEHCAGMRTQVCVPSTGHGKVPKWVVKTGES